MCLPKTEASGKFGGQMLLADLPNPGVKESLAVWNPYEHRISTTSWQRQTGKGHMLFGFPVGFPLNSQSVTTLTSRDLDIERLTFWDLCYILDHIHPRGSNHN